MSYNGGQIDVGLHYVPFSFSLPAQIPSSFYYKETLRDVKIEYRLKAKLSSPTLSMTTDTYLFIQQPVVVESEPIKQEAVWKIKEFGCCGLGLCYISLEMRLNVVRLGESTPVKLMIDN